MDFKSPTDEEDVDRIIEEQGERKITLQGDGGEPLIVSNRIAFLSALVKDALRDSPELDYMEISRVSGFVLRKVLEFMEHHVMVEPFHEIPDVIPSHDFSQAVENQWYRDFITNMDRDLLCQVLSAANYMMVKPLLDLICLFVTFQLAGKSAEEIREQYNFPEMSPEQEEAARKEHSWILD